ncbi:MAG TPA: TIR domain-containing protein, partial [Opitutaceae bacterium]|nr:TIR domain-containing protein [Opitutaceae bacterium]
FKAVFLSYASQDADAARCICDALRTAGVEVWFDQSELRGGDAWDASIRRQIKECALFVPVISAGTQARLEGYFRREWRLAVERMHDMDDNVPFLLPVVIDDTPDAAARVPERFRERQWTRLPRGATPAEFCQRVKRLLTGTVVDERANAGGDAARPAPRRLTRWWALSGVIAVLATAAVILWLGRNRSAAPGTSLTAGAEQLISRARKFAEEGTPTAEQLKAAAELVDRAMAAEPENAEAWAAGAEIDMWHVFYRFDTSAARRQQANTRSIRALQLDPDSFEARLVRATVLDVVLDQPAVRAEAEQILRKLLQESPGDWRPRTALASCLQHEGRFSEAGDLFMQARQWNAAGWTYFLGEDFDQAEKAARAALAADRSVANQELLAIIQSRAREDLDAAQATIDQIPASALLDDHPATLAVTVRLMRREPDKALEILRAIPRDWLSSGEMVGPKAYLTGLADDLAQRPQAAQAEWRAALQLVEQRLAAQGNTPDLLRWKAHLLARLGELEEARQVADLERQLAGRGPDGLDYYTAMTALLLGRRDAVIDWLTKALHEHGRSRIPHLHMAARYFPGFDGLRGDPRFEALLRETLPQGAKPFDEPAGGRKPPASLLPDAKK